MVCICFLVDQRRMKKNMKPVAATCSRCGCSAKVADMETSTRFCKIPFYWNSYKAIICTYCGATLKSYP
ncbi:uncharacterized protein LOC141710568 [Apium graveolens]|uniref:uncharacterized protein LOC141710568 n=1 Tax=Apium graveolens TaxID=4045 RepID=UPI003D7B9DDB